MTKSKEKHPSSKRNSPLVESDVGKMTTKAVKFLQGVPPFSLLPAEELEQIAPLLSIETLPASTVLCVQGKTKIRSLYIIIAGEVEQYYEERGREDLRDVFTAGDIFGGVSILINDSTAIRTVKVLKKSQVYTLPAEYFLILCKKHEIFSSHFTATFGKRMLDKKYAHVISKAMRQKRDTPELFDNTIGSICSGKLFSCGNEESLQNVAKEMLEKRCSSMLICNPEGDFVGIVTDNDFRKKAILYGLPATTKVEEIMSSPLISINYSAQIFEAILIMTQSAVTHLAVKDFQNNVVGVVTNKDIVATYLPSPFFLIREINNATNIAELTSKHQKIPLTVHSLLRAGAKPKSIAKIISTFSDAILDRIISIAIEEMEMPPPTDFVFLVLGSEARQEQTLKTDQDNAIVFKDVSPEKLTDTRDYFMRLADKICTYLDVVGYSFCNGGVMAKNPKLCQPLLVWKKYFSEWIGTVDPESLLQSNIFFDFRGAFGNKTIVEELQEHLFAAVNEKPNFFRYLAETSLRPRPPLGFFRNLVVESKGEHRNTFDIKSAMMPIVNFARLYSLKNNIAETNTLERLRRLFMIKAIAWDDYDELRQSYGFLLQLRFAHQIRDVVEEGTKPNNHINPQRLSRIERTMIIEIFKRIEKFIAKMSFDFIGVSR
ncbi:MAG: DUF294 nucleotidyltransferase-like domain-containing protein [Deltaproteobacteria bacterium]|nr:DUF294 nucleotidyltransferase-like domain-containing protein [Deltaproteobacteria bacterium]